MKRIVITLVTCLFLISLSAQEYPFSVTKTGSGKQALIFIPGFACSGEVWSETISELKEYYTCYALTMPGFSGTEPQPNPTFNDWKTQIAQFITTEQIQSPILIGHSMGGGLALAIASEYRDILKKLIIVDALPCLMALTNPGFKHNPNNDCTNIINRITAMNDEQFIQMQRISVATLCTEASKHEEIINWGLKSDRQTYAQIYCDYSNTDLREQLKTITIPTLILLEPQFKPIESVINDQYKNLPSAQIKYANKGLHFIMFDDKEWFINQVKNYLGNQ
ncbi:MAG: alpha/beta hydrolase [Tannerellaceae bacterium]|jgi:pimeloyl-ACP methyl ester carboxylesterase|nr:alpha/beta hydrolase [Tannerellaceae bacterium]